MKGFEPAALGGVKFRRPRPDEAEVFAALHVQCWREAYKGIVPAELMASLTDEARLPLWQSAIPDPERFAYGAFVDEVPVGLILAGPADEKQIEDQDGHLSALYIVASQHRRGIGRALLALAAEDWLARGGTTMTLGVLAENQPARAFYEALGAKLVKTVPYRWGNAELPQCIYVLHNLAKIAKV